MITSQRVWNFQGVNLSRDTLSLADQDVARALNVEMESIAGAMTGRLGATLNSNFFFGGAAPMRRMARMGNLFFVVGGRSLYAAGLSELIAGAIPAWGSIEMAPFRPLNDNTTWLYVPGVMKRTDGTVVYNWGITVPSVAPTVAAGAAGGLTGSYFAAYTYARFVGSSVVSESDPHGNSSAVSLAAQQLNITVTASADPQVTHIRLYRTTAGGGVLLFDQNVANASTTYASTQADGFLGAAVEEDNEVPPEGGWAVEHQGHIFLLQSNPSNAIYWSKRFRPDNFPANNFLLYGQFDDTGQCAFSLGGFLGLFTTRSKYRILGNTTSGFTLTQPLSAARGVVHPNAAAKTELGVAFCSRDGIFLTDFSGTDRPISQDIEPLFYGETVNGYDPVNMEPFIGQTLDPAFPPSLLFLTGKGLPPRMAMAYYNQRLYWSYGSGTRNYPDSMAVYVPATGKWYFYRMDVSALLSEERFGVLHAGSPYGGLFYLDRNVRFQEADFLEGPFTASAETATRYGDDPDTQKVFMHLRVDADVRRNPVFVTVLIDGVDRFQFAVTGRRTRTRHRLPDGLTGQAWALRFTWEQAGSDEKARTSVYGATMYFHSLRAY